MGVSTALETYSLQAYSPPPICIKIAGFLRPAGPHMTADEVTRMIQAGLPGAHVHVLTDDDTHFEAVVVAAQFEGKRSIQRHQLVYAGLGARMGREIHALSIQAYTPAEWQAQAGDATPG